MRKLKRNIFFFVTLFFIVTEFFPPFFYFIPIGQAMALAIYIGISLLLFPHFLIKRNAVAIIIYTLILLMKFWNGNAYVDTINAVVVPFLNLFSGTILLLYAKDNFDDERLFRWIPLVTTILLVVMACVSFPLLLINPNAIRGVSIGTEMEGFDSAQSYFVMSYGTLHAIPCLFPLLIFMLKRRKDLEISFIGIILIVVTLVILLALILMSNATTPLLVSAVLVLMSVIMDSNAVDLKTIVKKSLPLFLLFFIVATLVLVPTLDYLSENLTGNNAGKMSMLSSFIESGESSGDLDERMSLYADSKTLFFESPLTGTDTPDKISRHTYIWDQLALLGIVMAIPWAMIFIFNFRQTYSLLTYTKGLYLISLSGFLMMIYFKSGVGGFFIIFAIVPLLCFYIDKRLLKSKMIKR